MAAHVRADRANAMRALSVSLMNALMNAPLMSIQLMKLVHKIVIARSPLIIKLRQSSR